MPDLAILAKHLAYQFTDISKLEQALTHRSVGSKNNERLEYLGDAILGYLVATELYHRFPQASEGQLSRMRSNLVKGKTLAIIAKSLSIGDFLILGPGELKSGGFRRDSILAGAMEAVIGAVYLDKGMESCRLLVQKLFAERLAQLTPDSIEKDPKTRLQELMQSLKQPLPDYTLTSTDGAAHDQVFIVNCIITSLKEPTIGSGGSRRDAEQKAAQIALEILEDVADKHHSATSHE